MDARIIAELISSGDMAGLQNFATWTLNRRLQLKEIHVLYPYKNKRNLFTEQIDHKHWAILHPLTYGHLRPTISMGDPEVESDDP